jgi:GNAT superfamily N-acetyltransferase
MSNTQEQLIIRKAQAAEVPVIWAILQDAIEQRKQDGSRQWQDGYPNEATVKDDIENGLGYVLIENDLILAYAAIIFDIEPAYEVIEGKWLSNGTYAVVHRVATSKLVKGKGIATRFFKLMEDLCMGKKVFSIKVDTNFDNTPMLKIMDKLHYTYCGEVYFRGSARRAYEKVLSK